MFDIKLIEKFRFNVTQESEIEEDVKEAWFIFHNEFVRNVSYHWRHYLKNIQKVEPILSMGLWQLRMKPILYGF